MDTPRVALLVFVLIFFFLLPDTQKPSRSQEQELGRLLDEKQNAVLLLNSTSYGTLDAERNRWINITGFRQEDAYAWGLLPQVKEREREIVRRVRGVLETSSIDSYGSSGLSYKASGEEVPRKSNDSSIPDDTRVRRFSMYQNITGIVHGQWTRSKVAEGLIPPVVNLSSLAPYVMYVTKSYSHNITGQDGKLRIKLDEKNSSMAGSDDGSVREVRADLSIQDQSSKGDGWEMTLHGVHYPQQGGIILATSGQRFPGIFALPHFALSERQFSLARELLNQTVNARLARQESSLTNPYFSPWSSSPNNPVELLFPTPHCEYIVYLQQYPTTLPDDELREIEKELRYPTGAPTSAVPAMKMSALIFSPDCGFVLESKGPPEYIPQDGVHLVGQKLESYIRLARRGILAFAVILCAEIFLIIRQMKDASTPSTRSRVSFYTVSMMAFGDGFAFMGLMAVVVSTDGVFLPLIATAFVSFLSVAVFGMKFLMDVWTVQAPERLERDRRNAAANPTSADPAPLSTPAVITTAGADTLPLPATARRTTDDGPTNVILPPDQDLGAADAENTATAPTAPGSTESEMGAIYSQFYFLLFSVSFLSLQATSWPTTFRSIYTSCLTFGYLSFWVPQIYRNIIRNCRQALRWEFVVGQSILRSTPFVYLYAVEDNILFVEIDYNVVYVLVGWVWIQIWALISQEILGPRFFVPKGWAPPAYDYHPILREDDQEAGVSMPIGFTQTTENSGMTGGETTEEGKRLFDCAICMQNLEVPVVRAGDNREVNSMATTIFSRRTYMVTPCRHIFHSLCLQGWMRYRLQCPICRDTLPPL